MAQPVAGVGACGFAVGPAPVGFVAEVAGARVPAVAQAAIKGSAVNRAPKPGDGPRCGQARVRRSRPLASMRECSCEVEVVTMAEPVSFPHRQRATKKMGDAVTAVARLPVKKPCAKEPGEK